MFKKMGLAVLTVCILTGMQTFCLDSSARGRHGGIRVVGPDREATQPTRGTSCVPERINCSNERPNPRCATSCLYVNWDEGTIFLQGVVSDFNETLLCILDGGLSVDISEADLEYQPFLHHRGRSLNVDIDSATEEFVLEIGQHAFIQAEIVETDTGAILKASSVRVMNAECSFLDANEGGIRGVLDSFDGENGLAVIAGIPVFMDDATLLRTRLEEGDAIEPGDLARAHVLFVDTDGDEIADSFYAERISICKIIVDSDISDDSN